MKPTISSGEQILINGKSDKRASFAANAVLPLFGGPSRRIDTNPKREKKLLIRNFKDLILKRKK